MKKPPTPKKGTLHYIFLMKAAEKGEKGVTYLDFIGTGITEQNIESICQDLQSGMFDSDDPHHMEIVNEVRAFMRKESGETDTLQ